MHSLNHPNIVRILDPGGKSGCWCYYAMEFIDGPSLEALLEADCIEPDQRYDIAAQLLEAVAHAHHGPHGQVVHRDLKPANVLITSDGCCKVTDFDTAYIESGTALSVATAASLGTPFYVAPELESNPLLSAQHDPRLDVYAIGRILLRLFSGVPARESLVSRVLSTPDGLRSALSVVVRGRSVNLLCSLIVRATDNDPAKRFADAREVLDAFRGAVPPRGLRIPTEAPDSVVQMCAVPPGVLTMGHQAGTEKMAPDQSHTVTLSSGFLLGATPITRRTWSLVWGDQGGENDGDIPVENISWYGAIGFCNALSTHCGLTPCYRIGEEGIEWDRSALGFRLPTEAEWEYACRAGTYTKYYLGDEEADLERSAWYARNCEHGPMPVKLKESNGFGVFDMLGNVWEWCWDWYAPYVAFSEVDPTGPNTGSERVLRGGSWRREAYHCTCSWRYDSDPRTGGHSLGFRVARSLERT
jgi:formylglycine-generating enzyme required for sulfatase activity